MVSRDLYRVDVGLIIMRQPIHMVLDDIEWESIKLEEEMNQKYFKNLVPDLKLMDFPTDFKSFMAINNDVYSTHVKYLQKHELEAQKQEVDRVKKHMSHLYSTRSSKKKDSAEGAEEDLDEEILEISRMQKLKGSTRLDMDWNDWSRD